MDRELLAAQSGGKLLPKFVLFLETIQTKEHPQISNASFWKRGRENVFLQFGENESTPQLINGNKVVRAVMLLQKNLSRKISQEKWLDFWFQKLVLRPALHR